MRLTARGAITRERIVEAAADLMYVRGIGATTLDDVVDLMGERVIQREQNALSGVSTIAGLRRWRDALVRNNALRHGAYGCALGSFASEVADHDDVARRALMALFAEWKDLLAGAIRRLQERGTLPPDAPAEDLATGLLAALQGGYLLAQTAGDVAPMATSIDMALSHIESLSAH
jgi:TetR/AcrR family transcriptional repressor of nem operon